MRTYHGDPMRTVPCISLGLTALSLLLACPVSAEQLEGGTDLDHYLKLADQRATPETTRFKDLTQIRMMRMSYEALIAEKNRQIQKLKPPSYVDADDQTPDDPQLSKERDLLRTLGKQFSKLEKNLTSKKESFNEKDMRQRLTVALENRRDAQRHSKNLPPVIEDDKSKRVYELPYHEPPKKDAGQVPAGGAEPK